VVSKSVISLLVAFGDLNLGFSISFRYSDHRHHMAFSEVNLGEPVPRHFSFCIYSITQRVIDVCTIETDTELLVVCV